MSTAAPSTGNRRITLTLITPCLNAAKTIGETFSSVRKLHDQMTQQGLALEHLVIDGGSIDGTLEVIEEYQKKNSYSLLIKSVPGGPYPAMNIGLARASGVYSHILNADDIIWDIDEYLNLIRCGLKRKAQFLIGSIVYFTRPRQQVLSTWHVRPLPTNRSEWKEQIRGGLHYPHPGFICLTGLYRETGFDISYRYSADYKLMQSLCLSSDNDADIITVNQPIVAMARGGITSQWGSILKGRSEIKFINRELGIQSSFLHRYGSKAVTRYLIPWLQNIMPKNHPS